MRKRVKMLLVLFCFVGVVTAESLGPVVMEIDRVNNNVKYDEKNPLYNPADEDPMIAEESAPPGSEIDDGPFPPISPIEEFGIGQGGSYFRKSGGGGPLKSPGFEKPLDEYREAGSESRPPPGLGAANALNNLRSLASAAASSGGLRAGQGQGLGPNGPDHLDMGNGHRLLTDHPTLGPLYRQLSPPGSGSPINMALFQLGPGYGSHGPIEAPGILNALHSQVLKNNLFKVNQVGTHTPYARSHGWGINTEPLISSLEAVDANLKGTLRFKGQQLEQLDKERAELIAAAGKVALRSIEEKEKLVHWYGKQFEDKTPPPRVRTPLDELSNTYGPPPNSYGPPPGAYGPPSPEYGPPGGAASIGRGDFSAPPSVANLGFGNSVGYRTEPAPPPPGPPPPPPVTEILTIIPIYPKAQFPVKQVHNVVVQEEKNKMPPGGYGPPPQEAYGPPPSNGGYGPPPPDHGGYIDNNINQNGPYPGEQVVKDQRIIVDPTVSTRYNIKFQGSQGAPDVSYGPPRESFVEANSQPYDPNFQQESYGPPNPNGYSQSQPSEQSFGPSFSNSYSSNYEPSSPQSNYGPPGPPESNYGPPPSPFAGNNNSPQGLTESYGPPPPPSNGYPDNNSHQSAQTVATSLPLHDRSFLLKLDQIVDSISKTTAQELLKALANVGQRLGSSSNYYQQYQHPAQHNHRS